VSDDRKLLAVALARTAQGGQLAVGGVTAPDPGSGSDYLQSLIEALAYAADVLEADLDKLAAEAFIETSYDRGQDILSAQFGADLRPVVCVVLDPHNVYVATVGAQTGDSCVRFGDGSRGERPPAGFEQVAATYRDGDGDGDGALEVVGLGLGEPIWLIAVSRHHRPLFCRVGCRDSRAQL
jgi:hypothetical protein